MSKFLEEHQIQMAIVPVDLQTAANNGDWFNLKHFQKVVILLIKAIGTAGQDPIFRLQQATSAAGAGAKDLLFTTIWSKVGTQTAIAQFTKTTQAAATSYVDAVSAEAESLIAVEVQAEELDADGGFTHVRLDIADVGGNAQLGAAIYIGCYPRFQGTLVSGGIE